MKLVYVKNSGIWLVYNVLVYKWYMKVTKMSKIENSGIQTGICGNLINMSYTRKNAI